MSKYLIGIDYGTLSGRTVLVNADNGEELAEAVLNYPHAVMDERLPSGKALPPQFALQHPNDYLEVLRTTVPQVLKQAGVEPASVVGMGIDFTACTVLPVDANKKPLCCYPEFADEPHAYVKLWKHHAAQPEADEITALAARRGEEWLPIYGGKISSEWALPKLLQVLREAPEVYEKTDRFLEAADWLSAVLTGEETHSAAFAGYKALWNAESGYPSNDFLTALDPRLDGVVGTKLSTKVCSMDQIAGRLSREGAELVGLCEGTPLSLPMIDAHAAMPALKMTGDGDLMMIVGTSTCHILNSTVRKNVEGICGYVKDGVIPGFYTYEAGQAAVGDIFDWFVKNCVPARYEQEAAEKGINLHKLLREKAALLRPGESGLLALDWLNGNRSVLVNANLSGMMLGITLQTKPEEIYRAWIEATAYGTRMILDAYEQNGIPVNTICAAGGIAQKDAMMMQIYADVTGKEIRIAGSTQAGALGSAIYAAVAAGIYPDVKTAAEHMGKADKCVYRPITENQEAYGRLYAEYRALHDHFGRGASGVMERLRGR
ncbi:MAG: ribulokinase [Ruminococcaceae bacterium]|nr:ribulokinase [Oscillospiraceae bacterium]